MLLSPNDETAPARALDLSDQPIMFEWGGLILHPAVVRMIMPICSAHYQAGGTALFPWLMTRGSRCKLRKQAGQIFCCYSAAFTQR